MYAEPHDPIRQVVCSHEASRELRDEVGTPAPGMLARYDYEYTAAERPSCSSSSSRWLGGGA